MSSDQVTTPRDAALAQTNDIQPDDRKQEIERALCSQLDRVLDELWQFADDPSARTANSVALAQLALRLCRLYPRPSPDMRRRVALGEQVLELHGFDATYRRDALLGDACVRMTRIEAALLHYIVGNRDRIVSREAAAAVVTFVLLGRMLEARARKRLSDAVRALVSLAPELAHRIRGSKTDDVSPVCDRQRRAAPGAARRTRPS